SGGACRARGHAASGRRAARPHRAQRLLGRAHGARAAIHAAAGLRSRSRFPRAHQRQARDALQLSRSLASVLRRRRYSRAVARARRRSGETVDDRGVRAPRRLRPEGTSMRVRIWNAYASNNSGSYTIVGVLPSAEVARETAEELAKMIEAHTAWHADESGRGDDSNSPLAAFCRAHGLNWSPGLGGSDDWPQYGRDNRPRVAAFGSQVVVHHDYTVSLPPTFGEYFYKKGGRVMHEENHAHHPIVTTATFWWGWSKEERARRTLEEPRLVATLTGPDGALATTTAGAWPPAWRAAGEGFEAPLTVGIVFADLIGGVSALQAAADAHGARMQIRLSEAADEAHDPFAHLRPS